MADYKLDTSIKELMMEQKTEDALIAAKILTLGDLTQHTVKEITAVIGKKAANLLAKTIDSIGSEAISFRFKQESGKKAKKLPRQENLPGVENAAIKEIEEAALDYVEGRDERMEATLVEVERKTRLIEAMHKAGKTEYKRKGIEIKLTVEKEKVKVKISDEAKEKNR